ncbi:MAG TPA: redox-sensitive transcriptional activator SoxR [Actinobacteria bacterium]|nr:redox-sensitive transcriptional activator SoxR [bacterium BMS3Bbin02]HDL42294.1 redox-sensitive transcriptional activator SoxR [Actinomycetota bacterium]
MDSELAIGDVASRSGVAASALRFYEERGLIASTRNQGNQRRYDRSVLRRVAIIRAAQSVGLTLAEISESLGTLPSGRAPDARDWTRLSGAWRTALDDRIESLIALRDQLTDCIGCGCVSLVSCGLVNYGDILGADGAGARLFRVES